MSDYNGDGTCVWVKGRGVPHLIFSALLRSVYISTLGHSGYEKFIHIFQPNFIISNFYLPFAVIGVQQGMQIYVAY
jgi:hypothetical protein